MNDATFCEGPIPNDREVRLSLTSFTAVVSDTQGHERGSVSANLTETFTKTTRSCALTLNGTSSVVLCVTQSRANGTLSVTDQVSGQSFSETLDNLNVTLAEGADGSVAATVDGGLSVTCIGNLTLQTQQSIQIPAGAQCPTAGLVAVQRDDGASGQIQFNADGSVLIDYGDGTPDKTAASCHDASLSQCK
jgi:hypothetical protein